MDQSFHILTGMPSVSISHSRMTEDQIWEKVSKWEEDDYIMSSAVFKRNNVGLVAGHAYTTLGAVEYNGERLVKVRNPWGSERYKGPWSDQDPKWTMNARQQLNHEKANDGAFYVPLSLYKSHFGLTITNLYDEWKHTTHAATWDRKTSFGNVNWTLSNPADQRVVVGLTGPQNRMFQSRSCKSASKMESFAFSLKKKGARGCSSYIKDANARSYNWVSGNNGNGWLQFDNLPEGEYTLQLRYARASTTGDLDFGVETFANKDHVKIGE